MKNLFILFALLITQFVNGQKFEELAKTPPMGWNSWYSMRNTVDEESIKQTADFLVKSGLKDAGYEYVVIDDCWQERFRDENGKLLWDKDKFPSGIKNLADYVHSKGLKFGIYNCAGTKTCAGFPGIRGHEYQDARTYAEWGVDFIKIDWCNTGNQSAYESYNIISDAIQAAGRPMILSICEWGHNEPWKWAEDIGHMWRTTGDIRACWDCEWHSEQHGIIGIAHRQDELAKYAGPGHWNDPDMLMVGLGGLTLAEERSQFSLWAIMASPLMLSCNIADLSNEQLELLTNKEVLAVNQDELGIQGNFQLKDGNIEMWEKRVTDGKVFCFINVGDKPAKTKYAWKMLRINTDQKIKNLWTGEILGTTYENPVFETEIPPHDVIFIKVF